MIAGTSLFFFLILILAFVERRWLNAVLRELLGEPVQFFCYLAFLLHMIFLHRLSTPRSGCKDCLNAM